MRTGATISDLHLFSHHSRTQQLMEAIRDAAEETSLFVLNGDIFDFKWSMHGVFPRSVLAARALLESLVVPNDHCRFVILLGNHDCVPPYKEVLNDLADRQDNMEWHEFHYVYKDRLFLHGDIINAGRSREDLIAFRNHLHEPAPAGRLRRFAHKAAFRSRIPGTALKMLPKRYLASRILGYLGSEEALSEDRIRHVYFGHTHLDFEDFRYRGYTFHNAGAGTHGARLRIVRFPL